MTYFHKCNKSNIFSFPHAFMLDNTFLTNNYVSADEKMQVIDLGSKPYVNLYLVFRDLYLF